MTASQQEIDTSNYQLVGSSAGGVVVLMPSPRMTKDEALVHAAWIVTIATLDDDDPAEQFAAVLQAVRNT